MSSVQISANVRFLSSKSWQNCPLSKSRMILGFYFGGEGVGVMRASTLVVSLHVQTHRSLPCHWMTLGAQDREFVSASQSRNHISFFLKTRSPRQREREKGEGTVCQSNQKYRLQYWATRRSVVRSQRSLVRLLAPSAALTCSLARSLRSLPHSWENE